MADTGKQSPLGVNVLGSILNNTGLNINPVAASYMGASKINGVGGEGTPSVGGSGYTFGSLVQDTSLRMLTWAINDAYNRSALGGSQLDGPTLTNTTYDNLITIGAGTLEALGNSKPPTYIAEDPAGVWTTTAVQYGTQQGVTSLPGPATSGYGITGNTGQGQEATWYPYASSNPNHSITQWGWIRCHALQAWNAFNWNGTEPDSAQPEYKEFTSSYLTAGSWVDYSNQTVLAVKESETFLQGVYSNMSDLISSDIAGVNLASNVFGQDLLNLGNVIDLSTIKTFGLPSNLLVTLGKNNAITQDLSFALIAAGLANSDITKISSGNIQDVTVEQEQKIYGAFLIITGQNLANVLAPLQCSTTGFTSLADLLNVKKLFPNSYMSMTVPVYNSTLGLPTNSKTYYLIYTDSGVNSQLSTPAIQDYVGSQLLNRFPLTTNTAVSPDAYRPLPKGFGSYLKDIIPADQAIAAGAFSFTMRQIKNIENCNFKKFANVVKGMEFTTGLPLTNGTNKPTNQESTDTGMLTCALGMGPYGTYTMSDLFGCMSGLPYPWKLTYDVINNLSTTMLRNIYQQLFLAVTWQQATITVIPETRQVEISPGVFQTEYRVGSFEITGGGGYGRGTAPAPTMTCDNGATGTLTIGTDDNDAASLNGGSFGRIKTATVVTKGSWQTTIPVVQIQCPPITTLPVGTGGVVATGGVNTPFGQIAWPNPMNAVVQAYIDQANAEILSIQQNNTNDATTLQTYWNLMGTNLKREQRARYKALPPVTVPKDFFLNSYPTALVTFIDTIPTLSKDTRPHMNAQTIEAITNLSTVGGQSAIAMMRQERNQSRLQELGIELDNNLSTTFTPTETKTVLTNGTLPGAIDGIVSSNGNVYTPPAWPSQLDPTGLGAIVSPVPAGIYYPAPGSLPGSSPIGPSFPAPGFRFALNNRPGDLTPILDGDPNPVVNSIVPVNTIIEPEPEIVIIRVPAELDPDNLPPELDPNYASSTLLPSVLSVSNAIEQVVECNCDCWLQ
jgi:hypothetical protein